MTYLEHLPDVLQERLAAAEKTDPSQQLQVLQELQIHRLLAEEAAITYGAAFDSGEQDMIMMAGTLLADRLRDVIEAAKISAQINAATADRYGVAQINFMLGQAVQIAKEVALEFDGSEDPQAWTEEFERRVKEQIRVGAEQVGTELTPDQLVLAMDDTVPVVAAETGEFEGSGGMSTSSESPPNTSSQ